MYRVKVWGPVITFLWIAGVYLLTRNPHPGFGDALGFLYHAEKGFDLATNATSHFLYINFAHIVVVLLPFLSTIVVLSLLSVVFGLLSLERLYRLALYICKDRQAARFTVLIIAFSFTWWRQAVVIEVYTFYCFCVLQVWVLVVKDVISGEYRRLPHAGFWMGLSVLAHIQTLLLIPFFLLYLWWGRSNKKQVALSLGISAALGSVLVVLPLVFHLNPVDAVFFDNHFRGEVLGIHLRDLIMGSFRSLGYLLYNFHIFIPFLVHGLIVTWRQERKMVQLLGLAALPVWLFAMRYNVSDNYVFFLLPYFALAVFAGMSFRFMVSGIQTGWLRICAIILPFVLSPLIYFFAWKTAEQIPAMQAFANSKAYKGGIAFYLWPGQSQAPDPLRLAKEIREGKVAPVPDFERYPMALKYLEIQNL
ncbi:MAG: DUF2723 domain-containing protein [Bacteroidia bacterium]